MDLLMLRINLVYHKYREYRNNMVFTATYDVRFENGNFIHLK